MSISGISSNTSFLPQWNAGSSQQQWQRVLQVREDVTQLALALESGDLADAQKAYADLRGLQQASAASGITIPTDFATLGETLASNSLSQALNGFAQLQNDLESALQNQFGAGVAHGHHGHHNHDRTDGQSFTDATSGATPNSTGTAVDVIA